MQHLIGKPTKLTWTSLVTMPFTIYDHTPQGTKRIFEIVEDFICINFRNPHDNFTSVWSKKLSSK